MPLAPAAELPDRDADIELSGEYTAGNLGAEQFAVLLDQHWASVSNWAGIDWSMSPGGRAAIAGAIGVGAGLATVLLGYLSRSAPGRAGVAATSQESSANLSGRLGSGTGPAV